MKECSPGHNLYMIKRKNRVEQDTKIFDTRTLGDAVEACINERISVCVC